MSDENASLPAAPPPPAQRARIQTLVKGVQVKGFTFGKGRIIPNITLAMAQNLEAKGEVKILDIL